MSDSSDKTTMITAKYICIENATYSSIHDFLHVIMRMICHSAITQSHAMTFPFTAAAKPKLELALIHLLLQIRD
jgi:hypothetical protein